jgi:hypothetical protein
MWFLFVSWQYRVLGLLGDSDNCPGHWAKTHTHSGRRPATGWIVLQSLWKAVWYFLKKVQLRYHMYFHLYIDTQENKHLNMTAHSCISQSSPILEILQIFNWWMYEQQFIHHWLLSRINKMWSICTMKYWTKLSLGEPWKHDAKWKKLDMKATYCKIPFIWNALNGWIHRDREISGCQVLGVGLGGGAGEYKWVLGFFLGR